MSTLITVDEKNQVFHLRNKFVSYLFSVENYGLLSQLYFGKAIKHYHGQKRYPRLDRGFSGNPAGSLDRTFSPDTLLREFSAIGDGDYRIPTVSLKQEDGSVATQFTYKSYEIVSGKPALPGLPASYVERTDEAETLLVTLCDQVSDLTMVLSYTIYADRPVVTRSLSLTNNSQKAIQIEKIASMQLDLAADEFDVIFFPGAHVNERQVRRDPLTAGSRKFSSRRGATSHHMSNSILLAKPETTEFSGEVYGFNLVYSGNHSFEVEKDQIAQTRVVVGINEEGFSWRLEAGESFQTPEVLMVYSDQGLNQLSYDFHQLIRERVVRGRYKLEERPILVNNWEATYFDFTEEKLKPIVSQAKDLGIEMFVLDDGWFGHRDDDNSSLGDWSVDAKKFPKGLEQFANFVHDEGLKFGIWFEPEMVSFDSKLYRDHPDYLLSSPNRHPSPSRNQYVLDFSRADVRQNILDQMSAILDKGYIDYIKWDMNRNISDVYSQTMAKDRQGEVLHRYMLGLYQLLEELTSRYPDILWESCSGGGGRLDTGLAYYMPQTWTSDNTDAVARLKIQYGTSFIYPPSLFTSHVSAVPNHQTGRTTSLLLRGNVAMSSVFGYELDLTTLDEEDKKQVKEQVKNYQAIRHLVQFGRFYRLKSPFDGNICAWQFVSEDKQETQLFVFQVLSEAQPLFNATKFVGLDPAQLYQNTVTKETFYGDELMAIGLYQTVKQKDFATWQYHFKAINE